MSADRDKKLAAKWLGPTLLVSEDAAPHIAKQKVPLAVAAKAYGVSEQLMSFRLNVTGASKRVKHLHRT